ncbi:MAG: V-type ATP synthase subunit A, partial [Clostridiaceae bacterium]|nr:V-type ATP synthase subunit A [Clostridiaceae bacterium]
MNKEEFGEIVKVSGPLVVARDMPRVQMNEVVWVSEERLIGEVIEVRGNLASIQVYEETAGLGPGEPVASSGAPLSVELGPGLLGNMFDGIQRPLEQLRQMTGNNIPRGIHLPSLNRQQTWAFEARVAVGDKVTGGDIIGVVQETPLVEHRVMVPPYLSGVIRSISSGEYTVEDTVAELEVDAAAAARPLQEAEEGAIVPLRLMHSWPVRRGRPYKSKLTPEEPLVTGQRPMDTFFPIAKGGTAAVPGPFGSGKTVIQHQLAKWAEADIVVYIGCGERGNE